MVPKEEHYLQLTGMVLLDPPYWTPLQHWLCLDPVHEKHKQELLMINCLLHVSTSTERIQ